MKPALKLYVAYLIGVATGYLATNHNWWLVVPAFAIGVWMFKEYLATKAEIASR